MVKAPRRKKVRQTGVTRYEYDGLCVLLNGLEAQVKRNRADLDIQLRRIAELQAEITFLKKAQSPSQGARAQVEVPAVVPIPNVTTVES